MRYCAAIALILLALPLAASASHKPGHDPGPTGPDSLTLAVEPNPVVYGGSVTLSGRFTSANRAGRNVVVESDPAPFDTFANVASAVTSPSGGYSVVQKPLLNTRYRVRVGNTSAVVTVLVRIRAGLKVSDATPHRGERVRFFGRACPDHVGSLVRIQRRSASGSWGTVARTRLRDAARCSTYSRRVKVRRDGRYRVIVAADSDHARGISRTRFLDVN